MVFEGRMPFTCETKSAVLQKPRGGFTFPDGMDTILPFTLNGAPMRNRPEHLKETSEFKRKPGAYSNFAMKDLYFDKRNYYLVNLENEHILGPDTNTTLRHEGITFSLQFIALHRNLWEDSENPQVSLFFTGPNMEMFHLCIPIQYTQNAKTENLFLRAWLKGLKEGENLPPDFTLNSLLHLQQEAKGVRFAKLQYCLSYNKDRSTKPYIFCLSREALPLSQKGLPTWLLDDLNFTKPSPVPSPEDATIKKYRRKTFDSILNFMLRGTFRKYITDIEDPYLVSDEIYFDSSKEQDAIGAIYYEVKLPLSNLQEGFADSCPKKDIKCYPFDIGTQVTKDGKIQIDPNTNAPIYDTKQTQETPWYTPLKSMFGYAFTQSESDDAKLQKFGVQSKIIQAGFIILFALVGGIILFGIIKVIWGSSTKQQIQEAYEKGLKAATGAVTAVALLGKDKKPITSEGPIAQVASTDDDIFTGVNPMREPTTSKTTTTTLPNKATETLSFFKSEKAKSPISRKGKVSPINTTKIVTKNTTPVAVVPPPPIPSNRSLTNPVVLTTKV